MALVDKTLTIDYALQHLHPMHPSARRRAVVGRAAPSSRADAPAGRAGSTTVERAPHHRRFKTGSSTGRS